MLENQVILKELAHKNDNGSVTKNTNLKKKSEFN